MVTLGKNSLSTRSTATSPLPPKAYLVGFMHTGDAPGQPEAMLDELHELVTTQGLEIVGSELARIREYDPGTILGSGKVKEIIATAERLGAEVIVSDDFLSPSQQRNWEKQTSCAVIDRQEVILEIFAGRAQTNEARLQVQLAKANYALPRLVRKWQHLSRQRGAAGGLGGRAEGEQQLELDSRVIRKRIQFLNDQLAEVRKRREVQRHQRLKKPVPVVAIVGYTNAGKSSLLNRMTSSGVLVENKLFATLDTTVRRTMLPGGQEVLLADTVGFIRKLPHQLVEAFKSTLEETVLSDYILEVLDASDPSVSEHHDTVHEVLTELHVGPKPALIVLNKWDIVPPERREELLFAFPEALPISVRTGEGLEKLSSRLARLLTALMPRKTFLFPPDAMGKLAEMRRVCFIENEEYLDDGAHITARIPQEHLGHWDAFLLPQPRL